MAFRPLASSDVEPAEASSRFELERSRLGVYSVLSASASALPIPWIPESLLVRVRGAVVHDVATGHGVVLTPGARRILAQRSTASASPGVLAQSIRFVGRRLAGRTLSRFAPIGLFWPVRDALRTFALGHLLDYYLRTIRERPENLIDEPEARSLRDAIEGATLRILSVESNVVDTPDPQGDTRDAVTRAHR